MKAFICSFNFVWTLFLIFPLASCSSNDEDIEETPSDIETSAQLIELGTIRQTPIYNTSNGYQWNDFEYPDANLSMMSFSASNLIGEFGAVGGEEELEIIMEVLRKKTIDENKKTYSSVNYKKGYSYNSLDAVMNKSDYYVTKKEGGTLFLTKDKQFKIEKYLLGSRYVPGFAFSSAGLFRSNTNGLSTTSGLDGTIYYTEDEVFFHEEATNIPMYQYVDFRMLLHLRFLVRKGARDVELWGITEEGSVVTYSLDEDSDLIALSDEFEANTIETIWFLAKGDFRVDYFRGTIFSDESGSGKNHTIEYRFGESLLD